MKETSNVWETFFPAMPSVVCIVQDLDGDELMYIEYMVGLVKLYFNNRLFQCLAIPTNWPVAEID